jgi:hypothetical protein
MFVHCCHCRDCQRLSGSAFSINAMAEATNVVLLQGKTETIKVPPPSAMGQLVVHAPVVKLPSRVTMAWQKRRFVLCVLDPLMTPTR